MKILSDITFKYLLLKTERQDYKGFNFKQKYWLGKPTKCFGEIHILWYKDKTKPTESYVFISN